MKTYEKYLNEEKSNSYRLEYSVDFKINADSFDEAQDIAHKYLKTIKTKGKDKVIDLNFEYSEELKK